jgi:hypothetical protein
MRRRKYQNKNLYQDFMITKIKKSSAAGSLLKKLMGAVGGRHGRYYSTSVRRSSRGQAAEITFNLPPSITRQMQEAVLNGKQIRVFVP